MYITLPLKAQLSVPVGKGTEDKQSLNTLQRVKKEVGDTLNIEPNYNASGLQRRGKKKKGLALINPLDDNDDANVAKSDGGIRVTKEITGVPMKILSVPVERNGDQALKALSLPKHVKQEFGTPTEAPFIGNHQSDRLTSAKISSEFQPKIEPGSTEFYTGHEGSETE
jgi:hypothetical protein